MDFDTGQKAFVLKESQIALGQKSISILSFWQVSRSDSIQAEMAYKSHL